VKQLPKSIKVGPITYEVVQEARIAGDQKYGAILYGQSEIVMQAGLSPQHQQIVLWHELIHAMLTQYGLTDHDERIELALSHGIVGVLQDNPGLVK
jgi:Zn-dependent peptidase ImmA (M78 family)